MEGPSGVALHSSLVETLAIVLGILCTVALLLLLWGYFQTACWKNVVEKEIRPLVGSLTPENDPGGAIGDPSFTRGLTLDGTCVDRVIFGGTGECVAVCLDDTDQYDGDEEECLRECRTCLNKDGCVVAVPDTVGAFTRIVTRGEGVDYFRRQAADVMAFGISGYKFRGEDDVLVLRAPEEGEDVACLRFTQQGGTYLIERMEGTFETAAACRVAV
ncbi:MAG: hypothetical protein HY520_00740 [Candidatus Aenigmarchaeota archaeon]|nr:hypothetical protein [Candidatus Aenigmarchaeota archaeon]